MQVPPRYSLISGVAESLKEAINTGEFRDHLPGVRTLGLELCASVPTVRGAIKLLEAEGVVIVKHGCLTRIISSSAINEPDPTAGRKTIVLLAYAPIKLHASPLRDVADQLRKQGYTVVSHEAGNRNVSLSELNRLLALHPAACWVLLGSPKPVQEFFSSHNSLCLVASGSSGDGVHLPDFEIDFSALYRHLAHQFHNLGHRRFHLIIGKQSAQKNSRSLDAFVSAVRERGLDRTHEDLILTYDDSPEQLRALLERQFRQTEKPTGLCVALVSCYILTQGWLQSKGYRIPEDVSLICRDGDELMNYIIPAPSHYIYPAVVYGRRLARAIVTLAETGRVRTHTLLMPKLVKGNSMGPVPADI